MSRENVEIVHGRLAAVTERDPLRVLDLTDPDIECARSSRSSPKRAATAATTVCVST